MIWRDRNLKFGPQIPRSRQITLSTKIFGLQYHLRVEINGNATIGTDQGKIEMLDGRIILVILKLKAILPIFQFTNLKKKKHIFSEHAKTISRKRICQIFCTWWNAKVHLRPYTPLSSLSARLLFYMTEADPRKVKFQIILASVSNGKDRN